MLQGLNNLGPVNNFSDLILAAGNTRTAQNILAAEQLCHLVEGWRYGSSAVTAYLKHSKGAALHFAYYAELRAAISLFAWSGIRVLQNDYYFLDASGTKIPVASQKTHKATWEIWKLWTQRPDAQSLFQNDIQLLPNVALGNILGAIQYANSAVTFQGWGLDLPKVLRDHSARNRSSYTAYWTNASLTSMPQSDPELVLDLWRLILPDSGSALGFDSALIRYFVDRSVAALMHSSTGLPTPRSTVLQNICALISANTGAPIESIQARLDAPQTGQRPFHLAASPDIETENVLCRAIFLLRLATLAAQKNLRLTTNLSAKNWLTNWLIHAGLWRPAPGLSLLDLEVDYRNAVDSMAIGTNLPESIWSGNNLPHTAKIVRPDACLAWSCI